jgi:hypothetical protein
VSCCRFLGHNLIFVSTKPAAAQRPPAAVYFNQIETDQQGQKVASITPETVQGMGSSSLLALALTNDHLMGATSSLSAKLLLETQSFRSCADLA